MGVQTVESGQWRSRDHDTALQEQLQTTNGTVTCPHLAINRLFKKCFHCQIWHWQKHPC